MTQVIVQTLEFLRDDLFLDDGFAIMTIQVPSLTGLEHDELRGTLIPLSILNEYLELNEFTTNGYLETIKAKIYRVPRISHTVNLVTLFTVKRLLENISPDSLSEQQLHRLVLIYRAILRFVGAHYDIS